MPAAQGPALVLRPAGAGDAEVLFEIYASSRSSELAQVSWSEAEKSSFLRDQFRFQCLDWERNYPDAERWLLVMDGHAAGRLYLDRQPHEIRVVDIALLPDFRGRGIGGRLLRQLIEEAHTSGRPVTIHVERWNPALRLYQRLGFQLREDKGVYLFLECSPGGAGTAP